MGTKSLRGAAAPKWPASRWTVAVVQEVPGSNPRGNAPYLTPPFPRR